MRESEPKVDQDRKWHHSTGGDMSEATRPLHPSISSRLIPSLHFLSPNPLSPFPLPSTQPTSCRRLQMLQDPPPRPHHRLVAFAATNAGLDWQCWAACLCYAARTTGTTAIDSPPRTGLDGTGLARCPQKCSTTFGLRCRLSDPKLPQPGRRACVCTVSWLRQDVLCQRLPCREGIGRGPTEKPVAAKAWDGPVDGRFGKCENSFVSGLGIGNLNCPPGAWIHAS
ncbi:hypothetical protein FPQ18DRAFT_119418 [Pyronema domesticum]|nr:hypothetical protein FPQ18DRAFT_119418 [Pyronema domesticum]